MVVTDAFQLFHTVTSKISQKLCCCIKSNYCFFTGLWMPEDLRGTTASGQKSRLTLSYKPHYDPLHGTTEKVHFQYALFSTDAVSSPSFPHSCKQEVTQLPKKPFIN